MINHPLPQMVLTFYSYRNATSGSAFVALTLVRTACGSGRLKFRSDSTSMNDQPSATADGSDLLLVSQRHQRIDLRRSSRRDIASQKRDNDQQRDYTRISQWISRCNLKEQR